MVDVLGGSRTGSGKTLGPRGTSLFTLLGAGRSGFIPRHAAATFVAAFALRLKRGHPLLQLDNDVTLLSHQAQQFVFREEREVSRHISTH